MIVVVIIGILAAIAIPNFIAMQDRAKEGSTKANMHTFQLAAEDYARAERRHLPVDGGQRRRTLPSPANFKNPFTTSAGDGVRGPRGFRGGPGSHERASPPTPTARPAEYNIKGYGKAAALTLVLTAGQ